MSLLLIGWLAASSGIVVLEQPEDRELLERVLGQVGDLGRGVEVAARTSTVTEPMPHARQLARGRDAHAVVWIDRAGSGFAVTVVHVESRRLLSREIEPVRDRRRSASATKEAVALIVRSTLQAMDAWRAREEPRAVETAAPQPMVEARPPPAQRSPSLGFEAALGWTAAADGGSFGPHGPELRLAVRADLWTIGVDLATDLPQRLDDEFASIDLVRYRAVAGVGIDAFALGPIGFGAALSVGPSIYRRSTVATASGVIATPPSTTVALAIGGELRATYWLEILGGSFGIELAGGANGLIGRPVIVYERDGETVERARPWPVQPYGRLGVVFRSSEGVTRSEDFAPP